MPLEFVKSQRGSNFFVYKGFVHKQDRKSGSKITWRCNDDTSCTGRVHTMEGILVCIK